MTINSNEKNRVLHKKVFSKRHEKRKKEKKRVRDEGFRKIKHIRLRPRSNHDEGITITGLRRNATIDSIFDKFIDDEMIDDLIEHNAENFRNAGLANIKKKDILLFWGTRLKLSTINPRTEVKGWTGENRGDKMAKNRYLKMKLSLGFSDNFLIKINDNFQSTQVVDGTITIDEYLDAFTGKSPMKRFISRKPHPWGHLFWTSCGIGDKTGRSIINKFYLWKGETASTTSIVSRLLDGLVGDPLVVMDSYFLSQGLLSFLIDGSWAFLAAVSSVRFAYIWNTSSRLVKKLGDYTNFFNKTTGVLTHLEIDEKATFRLMSNGFFVDRRHRTKSLPLASEYRDKFNYNDRFDRILCECRYKYRINSYKSRILSTAMDMVFVNIWVYYMELNNIEMSWEEFFEKLSDTLIVKSKK